jgi:hypothetical protein
MLESLECGCWIGGHGLQKRTPEVVEHDEHLRTVSYLSYRLSRDFLNAEQVVCYHGSPIWCVIDSPIQVGIFD